MTTLAFIVIKVNLEIVLRKVFKFLSQESSFDCRGYTRSVKCVEFAPDDVNVFATG